ncbi:MAG: cation:proton antiporter [Bacteroidales bacterium]
MKQNQKNILYYIGMFLLFAIFFFVLIKKGESISSGIALPEAGIHNIDLFMESLHHELAAPLTILLLQIIVILIASRMVGYLFGKIGQPMVIGEIIAGILLGPSLLGKYFPDAFHFLFNPDSLGGLDALSKIGLILFMFIIGMELDLSVLRKKVNQTLFISHASILFPFFLGMLLSYFIYTKYTDGSVPYIAFSLFTGISMSITAFPVLARILQEKGLLKSHLGTVTIASAANDDITAWCLLAAVIAIAKAGTFVSALYTILLAVIYVAVMFMLVKPFMRKIGEIYTRKEVMNKPFIAFIFAVLILSSVATQIIGIHALFGAFLAGVVMSPNLRFRKIISEKIEDVALVLLLPLFFVFTGLRTEIGLLSTPQHWIMCGVFTLVAITGKFGGGAISAKLAGESWKDSLSIGILMNTRGLMELVVLNIGYDMGILPPTIFVMLVIMALVTTFMTSPLLSLIDRLFKVRKKEEVAADVCIRKYEILISFGLPDTGKRLLSLCDQLFSYHKCGMGITALHLTGGTDTNPMHINDYRQNSFTPIAEKSNRLHIPILTKHRVTNDITQGIIDECREDDYDLLLVGAGVNMNRNPKVAVKKQGFPFNWIKKYIHSNLEGLSSLELMQDKSDVFVREIKNDVGIFVNRNLGNIRRILMIITDPEDLFLIKWGERIMNNPDIYIQVIMTAEFRGYEDMPLKVFARKYKQRIALIRTHFMNEATYAGQDLMLVSYNGWKVLTIASHHDIEKIPSTLIIHHPKTKEEGEDEK